jgi:hypothetical protein
VNGVSPHSQPGAGAEIERLAAHFTSERPSFTTSPLYQRLCQVVAGDRMILGLLTQRQAGQQPSFLLFGAVHYLLLSGVQHPLRGYYPSLAGAAAAGPATAGPALQDFCRVYQAELTGLIRTRLVQSNVVRRAAGLRIALGVVRQRGPQPVHLVEVGASAGIHLRLDRYRYRLGGQESGPRDAAVQIDVRWRGTGPPPDLGVAAPIASRTGIDLHPVRASDPDQRRWLRALVWPENQDEAELLSAALGEVAADPPPVIAGDAIDVCPELGRRLPPGEPRLVFHAATRMHVPAARRAAFDAAIDALGAGGPLYHAWQEPRSAPHHGQPSPGDGALALHGPGDTRATVLAVVDGHLRWARAARAADQPGG